MMKIIYMGCMSLMVYPLVGIAHPFWQEHTQGWHWYQIIPRQINHDDQEKQLVHHGENEQDDASSNDVEARMQHVQHIVQNALHQAVLDPTPKNVRHYIRIQNRINQQAGQFANVWKTVIWRYPELDYSLDHPTNQIGKHLYLDALQEEIEQSIHHLAKHYGLFFFFSHHCPYCRAFAPIVKDLTKRYDISIVPISMDGTVLPEFPNAKKDNGIVEKLNIQHWPALLAVNPKTSEIIPIAYGLISKEELLSRIYILTKMIDQKSDFKKSE
jgi:conjugal transfer pilus assembly protein TraF